MTTGTNPLFHSDSHYSLLDLETKTEFTEFASDTFEDSGMEPVESSSYESDPEDQSSRDKTEKLAQTTFKLQIRGEENPTLAKTTSNKHYAATFDEETLRYIKNINPAAYKRLTKNRIDPYKTPTILKKSSSFQNNIGQLPRIGIDEKLTKMAIKAKITEFQPLANFVIAELDECLKKTTVKELNSYVFGSDKSNEEMLKTCPNLYEYMNKFYRFNDYLIYLIISCNNFVDATYMIEYQIRWAKYAFQKKDEIIFKTAINSVMHYAIKRIYNSNTKVYPKDIPQLLAELDEQRAVINNAEHYLNETYKSISLEPLFKGLQVSYKTHDSSSAQAKIKLRRSMTQLQQVESPPTEVKVTSKKKLITMWRKKVPDANTVEIGNTFKNISNIYQIIMKTAHKKTKLTSTMRSHSSLTGSNNQKKEEIDTEQLNIHDLSNNSHVRSYLKWRQENKGLIGKALEDYFWEKSIALVPQSSQ